MAEAVQPYDLESVLLGAYDGTWGGTAFGAVDQIEPNVELVLKEKRVGSLGPVDLGHWVVGMGGEIVTAHREIKPETYQLILPWYDDSDPDRVQFMPAGFNEDLYDYAQHLTLHPQGVEDDSLDLQIPKAVPYKIQPPKRNGDTPDVIMVSWKYYPDRSKFTGGSPTREKAYMWLGPTLSPPPPPPPP